MAEHQSKNGQARFAMQLFQSVMLLVIGASGKFISDRMTRQLDTVESITLSNQIKIEKMTVKGDDRDDTLKKVEERQQDVLKRLATIESKLNGKFRDPGQQ